MSEKPIEEFSESEMKKLWGDICAWVAENRPEWFAEIERPMLKAVAIK